MLLGPPNKGVHVVVWGECQLDTETVKMWLGIPADTLMRIGYKNLSPDYVLPIPLRGRSRLSHIYCFMMTIQERLRIHWWIGMAHSTRSRISCSVN